MSEPSLWAAASLVTPMAIRVAATLRLADHIAAGVTAPAELAAAVGAEAGALERVMNHLVTAGVLTPEFRLTALGEQLRDDHPAGFRAWLDLGGAIGRADLCFVELLHTVRTGEPSFPERFGRPYWDDLAQDPALSGSFDELMARRLGRDLPAIAAAYPWGDLGHVVDVGGGNGRLLIALLQAHHGLRGTVVDQPDQAENAAAAIEAAGLTARARSRAGSFFDDDALPTGAGGYVLSGVLPDWADPEAEMILHRCATAAGDGGRVLVIDNVGETVNTEGDLRMLCYVGGRERRRDELRLLAEKAGLTLARTVTAGTREILELHPIPGYGFTVEG